MKRAIIAIPEDVTVALDAELRAVGRDWAMIDAVLEKYRGGASRVSFWKIARAIKGQPWGCSCTTLQDRCRKIFSKTK